MRFLFLFLLFVLCSCAKQRVIKLPEIKSAKITEVNDISPIYIFYDETQLDSTLFNRKNMIGTTNWLVNVDKRLTLKQVFPHLQYLQNKRRKSEIHKNENARNYFTCNDLNLKNLGFLDFTTTLYKDVVLKTTNQADTVNNIGLMPDELKKYPNVKVVVFSIDKIQIHYFNDYKNRTPFFKLENLKSELNQFKIEVLELNFNKNLTFQDYISVKEKFYSIINTSDISDLEYVFD